MPAYSKPYLTYSEQLDLLKSRGLIITDKNAALKYLEQIGYYRLSAYWYPFRKKSHHLSPQAIYSQRSDEFVDATAMQTIVDLYVFDKKLRLLILDAIERIEIAIRSSIAYQLGKNDKFAHKNPNALHGNFAVRTLMKTGLTEHSKWLEKLNTLIARSKEEFVQHYKQKYDSQLPIWVAVELWDFGMLSTFYKGMKVKDKSIIAGKYRLPNFNILESWLRTINYIRNVCAHHSRLWNRNLIDQPKLPKYSELTDFNHIIGNPRVIARPYVVICMIIHLMKIISPNSSWKMRLRDLIAQFPHNPHISVDAMGFPKTWEQENIWK